LWLFDIDAEEHAVIIKAILHASRNPRFGDDGND